MPPTLYLICGLPGAGKTTLAKQIEVEQNALRLTPDDWLCRLFGNDRNVSDTYHDTIEILLWETAERALQLGVNVVLDYGFWTKEERASFRKQAESIGARVKLISLEVPREELWRRLQHRNQNLPPNTYVAEEWELDEWFAVFEPPISEELDDIEGMNEI
jgi:predicted kinase